MYRSEVGVLVSYMHMSNPFRWEGNEFLVHSKSDMCRRRIETLKSYKACRSFNGDATVSSSNIIFLMLILRTVDVVASHGTNRDGDDVLANA